LSGASLDLSSSLHAFVLVFLASLGRLRQFAAGKSLDPQDPFERFNRASFSFNDSVDMRS